MQPHGSHRRLPTTKRKDGPRSGNGADPPDEVARGTVACHGPPARLQCQDSHFYEVPTDARPGSHRKETANKPKLRDRLPHDLPSSSAGPREQRGKAGGLPRTDRAPPP